MFVAFDACAGIKELLATDLLRATEVQYPGETTPIAYDYNEEVAHAHIQTHT